ncbi:MAG TPA: radical SAM protein [Miltoncostaea sp.]|nr:radical SAM protein [Miltoncostaea sp.]
MGRPAPTDGSEQFRWRLAGDEGGQSTLLAGAERHEGRGELAGLELLHVRAKTIINRVPDRSAVPFRWTINPYRGCSHACVYCFARPTHEYLGFDIGQDFDRRIVIKVNAVERLRAELRSPRWAGEEIAMGTNTDPYQPVEGRYRLTRGIVETLADAGNPFSILTKSTLIGRDIDVLTEAATRTEVNTAFSIGCLDEDVWRLVEPHTPNPMRRMETVARFADAGLPCGILMAPILPGISDDPAKIEAVVRAAVEAGATSLTPILLHLRPGVRDHYLAWLEAARPELMPEMRRRYRRAYAPAEERERLAAMVREMVARHGGLRRGRRNRFDFGTERRGGAGAPPAPAPDVQLSLL